SILTDGNGYAEIKLPEGEYSILITHVAYTNKEVIALRLGASNTAVHHFTLQESNNELGEVVVTALGIKRQDRSLGYSVGNIKGEDINRVSNDNFMVGMAGKVPGVSINSTGPAGSSVSMVIRGASSLSSDNQPLFVVDGVPMMSSLNNIGQIGDDNKVDY